MYNSAEYNVCCSCPLGATIRSHRLAVRFVGQGGNGTGAVARRGCPAASAAGGYRSRFLSMGYGEIWKGNFEKSIALLERALSGFQKGIERDKQSGREVPEADQEDYNTVLEILSMMQRGDTKAQVIEKMQEIERIALNKAWGVTLSSESQTTRLKKKELL